MAADILHAGAPLESAQAAIILVHGRGATADSMFDFAAEIVPDEATQKIALFAPQAQGFTWYPYSFMSPMAQNEPHLSMALQTLAALLEQVQASGILPERVLLLGFSQGACLSLEFAARHPRRYGGIAGLSGGLIGSPGTRRDYPGSLAGTPVFLGCSDVDPHIPLERVQESAQVLKRMGAQVEARIYPGMGHTVNADEIDAAQKLIRNLLGGV